MQYDVNTHGKGIMMRRSKYLHKFQQYLAEGHIFTLKELSKALGCSQSTASRLVTNYYSGYAAWQPVGGGNFAVYHMPPGWTEGMAKTLLDSWCKSGKSRARIFKCEADRNCCVQPSLPL